MDFEDSQRETYDWQVLEDQLQTYQVCKSPKSSHEAKEHHARIESAQAVGLVQDTLKLGGPVDFSEIYLYIDDYIKNLIDEAQIANLR